MAENSLPDGRGSEPNEPEASEVSDAKKPSVVRRALLAVVIVGMLSLAGVALALGLLYQAATASLPEYEALIAEQETQQSTGDLDRERQELESQVAALVSDAQSQPRWTMVVSAAQINGWLAMQLPVDFPELERQGLRKPRVMLKDGAATLACRATVRGVDAVTSITVAPVVAEDGWVGLEARSIKVGRLPLPVSTLMELVEKALAASGPSPDELRYRWGEDQGNPVLLFDVENLASTPEQNRRIDTLEVRDGQLYLGGVTEERGPVATKGVLAQPQ